MVRKSFFDTILVAKRGGLSKMSADCQQGGGLTKLSADCQQGGYMDDPLQDVCHVPDMFVWGRYMSHQDVNEHNIIPFLKQSLLRCYI